MVDSGWWMVVGEWWLVVGEWLFVYGCLCRVIYVGRTFRSAFGEAEAPPYVVRGKWWIVDGE
jgi:hypothetical protein